jgi:hypothetical protein
MSAILITTTGTLLYGYTLLVQVKAYGLKREFKEKLLLELPMLSNIKKHYRLHKNCSISRIYVANSNRFGSSKFKPNNKIKAVNIVLLSYSITN